MPDYDFRALSSLDFEVLVRDLLQEELGVRVESFKQGKDKGVDLRFAMAGEGAIVQCKHFVGSGYAKLAAHLAKSERPKIEALNPQRYILTTSVPLSAVNKDELVRTLAPYCKGPLDVLGKEDLNNLLGRHPEVEKRHFKLWLSSSAVLEKLLHARTYTQTELELEMIQDRVARYVQNESYAEARKILDELHYCVICGVPGIGKTMLADMLVISLIAAGYEAIKITGDVGEALDVYRKAKPQVFYYDDFLGQTTLEQKLGKNEDHRLLVLLDRVKNSESHRFLLTTREYILNQAKAHYERLASSRFDVRKCVVSLERYTVRDRAKILFNHLYFSRLGPPYIEALFAAGAHRAIVRHPNFNPRVVEWMTTMLAELPAASRYPEEFLKTLDNPERLWEHAFTRQLSAEAQTLLMVLGSLPPEVLFEDAAQAFGAFWMRAGSEQRPLPQGFRLALEELDGTFARTIKDKYGKVVVAFHSPSIRDFVERRLRLDGDVAMALAAKAIFFEQAEKLEAVMATSPAMADPEFAIRWHAALGQLAERTLVGPSCKLARHDWQSGEPTWFSRQAASPEARFVSLVGMLEGAPREQAAADIGTALGVVRERWRADRVSNSDLEDVVTAIAESPHLSGVAKTEAVEECTSALLRARTDLETFQTFRDLSAADKLKVAEAHLQEAREKFRNSVEELLDLRGISDREAARDMIAEVADVARSLGLDISGQLEAARDEADQIESEEFSPPNDEEEPQEAEPGEAREMTDEEIDDMLAGLNER